MPAEPTPPLPPIIEPWRIFALILIVIVGMGFAYFITPPHAETASQHQSGSTQVLSR